MQNSLQLQLYTYKYKYNHIAVSNFLGFLIHLIQPNFLLFKILMY